MFLSFLSIALCLSLYSHVSFVSLFIVLCVILCLWLLSLSFSLFMLLRSHGLSPSFSSTIICESTPLQHKTFINEPSSLPNFSGNDDETVHNIIDCVADDCTRPSASIPKSHISFDDTTLAGLLVTTSKFVPLTPFDAFTSKLRNHLQKYFKLGGTHSLLKLSSSITQHACSLTPSKLKILPLPSTLSLSPNLKFLTGSQTTLFPRTTDNASSYTFFSQSSSTLEISMLTVTTNSLKLTSSYMTSGNKSRASVSSMTLLQFRPLTGHPHLPLLPLPHTAHIIVIVHLLVAGSSFLAGWLFRLSCQQQQ